MRRSCGAALAFALLSLLVASSAFAGEPAAPRSDNLTSPMQQHQQLLREKAAAMQANGTIPAGSKVGKVAKGQYVQLAQTGHSDVFVILAEFGDTLRPPYGGTPGPLHNQIPAPNRNLDNTTIWFDGGYGPQHYQQLYFDHTPGANSLTNYYQGESSGQFNFDGAVTDWTKVPYNEARYGTDSCGSTVCAPQVWNLLRDAANQWVLDQLAAGKSMSDIQSYLSSFDKEDRYDYNANGNFNEPDHYIDHYQLIHAGEGQEIGGGAQGSDAIWSHRWYAWSGLNGADGPGPAADQYGGFEIGAGAGHPTGYWVGDYVMEPENAGVGVIAHETGHDYGLPDEYDTSYAGEAPSSWWTIMSQGSYGNDATNGIGNRPVDFNAWDKFQLGWLNYQIARPFTQGKSEIKLGPAETNTKQAQGVFVILPKKPVATVVGTPTEGTKALFSGSGDSYDTTAARSVAVPAAGSLSADVWYDIEQDWDYAYLEVSSDNGAHWTNVATNLSTSTDPNGQNAGQGITGTSGAGALGDAWYTSRPAPVWVSLTANLSAYAGQTVLVRFEYWTDVASHGSGFEVDNMKLNGTLVDGFESTTGWTLAGGFHLTTGADTSLFNNYYVVENRQYMGYDTGLLNPYNFSDPSRPNWVEHYPFQDGVLVSYWDTSQGDNNTGQHNGSGLILPIDVHQNVIYKDTGAPARNRIQAYDATLSTTPTDALTLHNGVTGAPYYAPSQPGITTFDDRGSYWNPLIPDEGVKTPGYGTIIQLKSIDSAGFANVAISAAN